MMPNRRGESFVWQVGLHNGSDFRIQANPGQEWYGRAPGLLKPNTLHTTVVRVRRGYARCLLDGKELLRRDTNFKDLTIDS